MIVIRLRRNEPSTHAQEPEPTDDVDLRDLLIRVLNGETLTLTELSFVSGIKPKTIHMRIKRGWSIGTAVSQAPVSKSEAGRMGRSKSPWRSR